MGDTFYIPFQRKVEKEHHLAQEANAYGAHDRFYFTPATEGRIRCFKCNRLFDSSLLDTGKCPNCLYSFTKAEARDAYVESVYHKVNYGKWTDALIQLLGRYHEPSLIRPDGRVVPMNESARKVVEYYVAQMRKQAYEDANLSPEMRKLRDASINEALNRPVQPRRI